MVVVVLLITVTVFSGVDVVQRCPTCRVWFTGQNPARQVFISGLQRLANFC